jgi:AcrR family transcriptional regulator
VIGVVERDRQQESPRGRTVKSEQTRSLIVQTALRLFREQGYDRTTMRAIAAGAGVSVGNAYYYFASKEHLVQGFYDQLHHEHLAACQDVLADESELGARLRGVLHRWFDVAEPYHEFAGQFFRNAADPGSPLSPFSAESGPVREANIALHRQVLDGSTARPDPELRAELPDLMWLYHMGVVLFWVYDRSPGRARTRLLIDRTTPLVERLVRLSRLRVLRSVTRDVTGLLRELGLRRVG